MLLLRVLLTMFALVPVMSFGQTIVSMDQPFDWEMDEKLYQAEGIVALYSLGQNTSPSFGASIDRELFQDSFLGFRALIPMFNSSAVNMYTLQTYSRYFLVQRQASVFMELDLGVAGLSGSNYSGRAMHFLTAGFSLGSQYEINNDIYIGGMIGTGFASRAINEGANYFPKVAMTSTFKF